MRIETLTIKNFRGIENLQVTLNGYDAVVSGQNGSGKTTIADAVCWLLSGKMSDGKTGENQNIKTLCTKSEVELKFDNGLILRRETDTKSVYYVNGTPCNTTEYQQNVAMIFNGAVATILTPFNFCRMHYSERRAILMKLIDKPLKIDIEGEFGLIAEDLKSGLSPVQILKREKENRKRCEKEMAEIPARISEINLDKPEKDVATVEGEITKLRDQLDAKSKEIRSYKANDNTAEILKIERGLNETRAQYRENEIELNRLRKEFSQVKQAETGICPTCGSKVPVKNLAELEKRVEEIIAEGKNLAEKQEVLKQDAAAAKARLEELRKVETPANELEKLLQERDEIQERLTTAKIRLSEIEKFSKNQARIKELRKLEVELGQKINDSEQKIYLAESYTRLQIELTEQAINSKFEFVKFKMFESYKVSEGVKECCEPLLKGVPYSALSKGEKLKASLDILKTLQKYYKVELPIFIDDAESYTSNSFIDLPNQKIYLKATEGVSELQVEVMEERRQSA